MEEQQVNGSSATEESNEKGSARKKVVWATADFKLQNGKTVKRTFAVGEYATQEHADLILLALKDQGFEGRVVPPSFVSRYTDMMGAEPDPIEGFEEPELPRHAKVVGVVGEYKLEFEKFAPEGGSYRAWLVWPGSPMTWLLPETARAKGMPEYAGNQNPPVYADCLRATEKVLTQQFLPHIPAAWACWTVVIASAYEQAARTSVALGKDIEVASRANGKVYVIEPKERERGTYRIHEVKDALKCWQNSQAAKVEASGK